MDPTVLNLALNLSLEFGAEWRQSVVDRLLQRRSELNRADAEELGRLVERVRDSAHSVVATCFSSPTPDEGQARRQILDNAPWIDDATFERLWRQGCYYAMKR